jgi:hypothetical protein
MDSCACLSVLLFIVYPSAFPNSYHHFSSSFCTQLETRVIWPLMRFVIHAIEVSCAIYTLSSRIGRLALSPRFSLNNNRKAPERQLLISSLKRDDSLYSFFLFFFFKKWLIVSKPKRFYTLAISTPNPLQHLFTDFHFKCFLDCTSLIVLL